MLGLVGLEEVVMVVSEDKVGMVEEVVGIVEEEVDMVDEDVVHSIKTLEKGIVFGCDEFGQAVE